MRGVWERQICFARSILEGLLKTHSHSVNNESLVTLMTEVELIISSRPLTVETMNDTKSDMPLSPSHLVTIKTNVVIPPSGEFSGPNLYSERRWRISEQMEKIISPTTSTEIEEQSLKFRNWRCCIVKG